ncbi:hypothetical protein BJ322DRAFT_1129720, partial [Thelephora terrestris]
MKHLLKVIRNKKTPKPSHQVVSPGNASNIVPGPSDLASGLTAVPEDEGSRMDSFQHNIGEDVEHPASKLQTFGVVVGGPGHGYVLDADDAGGGEIESPEASRTAKRTREGTFPGGANKTSEKFGRLKLVLGAIPAVFATHEGSVAVGNRIEILLSRTAALEEHFNSRPAESAELRRRDEWIRKLKGIEGQLRSFSEKAESQQLTDRTQDDEEVFGLLEDLQEEILHYQMVRRTRIHDQSFNSMDPAESATLDNLRCAHKAEYRHSNRDHCLKGTRRNILDEIELWTRNFNRPSVYWLNGLAGTGKSTIAQTIAERAFADGRLGASFFCSRDFEDRRNLQFILPAIAIQLARRYTEFRSIFIPLVRLDPEIIHESMYGQMDKLIVQPLVKSAISTVIVIDALDECQDDEPASAILSVLGQFVNEIPKVKFFITGRPEPRIREGFRLPLLAKATDVFILHEVEPDQVNCDIGLFYKHNLSEIKRRRQILDNWPVEEQLDLLCGRVAGLFVYAMATVRFIDQKTKNPKTQLDRLLQSQDSGPEGKAKLRANSTLDSLYLSILHEAFSDNDPEDDAKVRSVLGAVILAKNPLSQSTIAALLGFDSEDISPLLSLVCSLLILPEDINHPVQPFHKSFPDFIVDSTRCTNPRFCIYPPDQHAELLVGCLELMDRQLKQNMCKLPDGVKNAEVKNLKQRAGEHISKPLEYACRSWHKHLDNTISTQKPKITHILHQFLERKFLFWLEVLSIYGAAREAVDALEKMEKWLDVSF